MNFKQLLNKFTDEQILRRLIYLYRDQKKNIKGYKTTLKILKKKKERQTDVSIMVEKVIDMDGEKWIDVTGRKKGDNTKWAIEFTPWSQWLNMKIDSKSLTDFKELDILAHCLWEMTFDGYSEQPIRNTVRMLNRRIKDSIQKYKKYN